tara:strand:- start:713 stop:982 length:270 start_codon:yes stop_codon:yes gene_type:complete
MKNFTYKIIIVTIFLIIFFEFTIGKRLDPISNSIDKISNKEGRNDLMDKLRQEMRDGLEKEYILNEDDRILIYKFINKIQSEINTVEKN